MAVSAARADLRPAAIDWDGLDALKYEDEREAARRIDALVGWTPPPAPVSARRRWA